MKMIENELDNIHIIQYLDSIVEEDEEVITIDLKKKTLKKMIRCYKELDNLSIGIDIDCQIEKDNKATTLRKSQSNFSEDKRKGILEKFKEQLNTKETNLHFEINQIMSDVFTQLSHNNQYMSFKHYSKYINSLIKNKDDDYAVIMLKAVTNQLRIFLHEKFDEFEIKNSRLKQCRDKFESFQVKQKIQLPKLLFIDVINKKKLDLSSLCDIGLNNITLLFSDIFMFISQMLKLSEQLDQIFALLLGKFKEEKFEFKKLVSSCLYTKINNDSLMKYILIAIKQKSVKTEEIALVEAMFVSCNGCNESFQLFIDNEIKKMLDRMINNHSESNFIQEPITPDNSQILISDDDKDKDKAFTLSDGMIKFAIPYDGESKKIKQIRQKKQMQLKESEEQSNDLDDFLKTEDKRKKKVISKKRTQSDAVDSSLVTEAKSSDDKERKSFIVDDKKTFLEEINGNSNQKEATFKYSFTKG